jgi:hypothetical protein
MEDLPKKVWVILGHHTATRLTPMSLVSGRDRGGTRGTPHAEDHFFRLHDEEEQYARHNQPWPKPKQHGLGVEKSLERRRVGEQDLQDHDRA